MLTVAINACLYDKMIHKLIGPDPDFWAKPANFQFFGHKICKKGLRDINLVPKVVF